MKKLFIFAALAFGLAACETKNEESAPEANVNGNEAVEVTITATAPVVDTRADYDHYYSSDLSGLQNGSLQNHDLRYIMEVYDSKGRKSDERYYGTISATNPREATFSPRLIPGRAYTFVVWADFVAKGSTDDLYYDVTNIENITVKDAAWTAMAEARDAYTGKETATIEFDTTTEINVRLTRPFAKLRFISTDMNDLADLGVTPAKALVEYKGLPSYSFNAFTQAYTALTDVTKSFGTYDIAAYEYNGAGEKTLFSDYFFAPDAGQTTIGDVELTVYEADGTAIGRVIAFTTDIPAQRNILTTIKGNLLTRVPGTEDSTTWSIKATINDAWGGEEMVYDLAGNEL